MSPLRKTAFAAGALYLLSLVSIPTLFLYNPLRASDYIIGHGSNTGTIVGAILEMVVALAGIRTAGRRAFPGRQEAEGGSRSRLRRHANPGRRRHPRWRGVHPVARDLAAGGNRNEGIGHRPCADNDV